jgi:hypothetical protein
MGEKIHSVAWPSKLFNLQLLRSLAILEINYTIDMKSMTIDCRLKILPVLTRKHYTSLLHWV